MIYLMIGREAVDGTREERGLWRDIEVRIERYIAMKAVISGVTGFAVWAVLAASYLIHWTPRRWLDQLGEQFTALPAPLKGAALAALAAGVATVAETDVVPFIYFQF